MTSLGTWQQSMYQPSYQEKPGAVAVPRPRLQSQSLLSPHFTLSSLHGFPAATPAIAFEDLGSLWDAGLPWLPLPGQCGNSQGVSIAPNTREK